MLRLEGQSAEKKNHISLNTNYKMHKIKDLYCNLHVHATVDY